MPTAQAVDEEVAFSRVSRPLITLFRCKRILASQVKIHKIPVAYTRWRPPHPPLARSPVKRVLLAKGATRACPSCSPLEKAIRQIAIYSHQNSRGNGFSSAVKYSNQKHRKHCQHDQKSEVERREHTNIPRRLPLYVRGVLAECNEAGKRGDKRSDTADINSQKQFLVV